jgi:hypothetical protein
MDDFIGQRFGKTRQVEVLGLTGTTILSGYNKLYYVKCYICAKDPELFGEAVYKTLKGNIKLGQLPCGCGKAPRWTETQQIIRIRRKCAQRQMDFQQFTSRPINTGTKLQIKCLKCKNIWSNCTVNNFLNQEKGNGCPTCAKSGFQENQEAYLYLVKVVGDFEFTGYGITNHPSTRLRTHRRYLRDFNCQIEKVDLFKLTGLNAKIIEDDLQMRFPRLPHGVTGFKTESTLLDLFDDVVDFVKQRMTKIGGA